MMGRVFEPVNPGDYPVEYGIVGYRDIHRCQSSYWVNVQGRPRWVLPVAGVWLRRARCQGAGWIREMGNTWVVDTNCGEPVPATAVPTIPATTCFCGECRKCRHRECVRQCRRRRKKEVARILDSRNARVRALDADIAQVYREDLHHW